MYVCIYVWLCSIRMYSHIIFIKILRLRVAIQFSERGLQLLIKITLKSDDSLASIS